MKVRALEDIPSARGVIPAGKIIDVPESLLERLKGRVEPLIPAKVIDMVKYLPHYCETRDCLCSSLLPKELNPTKCKKCEIKMGPE